MYLIENVILLLSNGLHSNISKKIVLETKMREALKVCLQSLKRT
jgi:hypothetical protein